MPNVRLIWDNLSRLNSLDYNIWEKTIFLDNSDYGSINNTIIKCNRDVFLNHGDYINFVVMLTDHNATLSYYNGYDFHGELQTRDLTPDFANLVDNNIPNGFLIKHVGFALRDVGRVRRGEWGHVEIRYERIVDGLKSEHTLNLHIKRAGCGRNVDQHQAFNHVTNCFQGFNNEDAYTLARLYSMNLDNFRLRGFHVSHKQQSQGAYQDYQDAINGVGGTYTGLGFEAIF